MQKTRLLFGLLLVLAASQIAAGQGVRRSVIASFGDAGTVGNLRMSCTAGQPPNAGTVQNGGYYLRQGFQQPLSAGQSVHPDCADAPPAEFVVDATLEPCGERFDFQYAALPDTHTVFSWDFGQDAVPATADMESPQGVVYTSPGAKTIRLEVRTDTCVFVSTTTINVSSEAFAVLAETEDASCANLPQGRAGLLPVNGAGPFAYLWDDGATTPDRQGLPPGDYSFTVTAANGCEYAGVASIDGPDSLRIAAILTPETCYDEANGSIDVTVSGGQPPYQYQWSNGMGTPDLFNLSGQAYSLLVTDALNCQVDYKTDLPITCQGMVLDNVITPNGDGANDAWVIPEIVDFPEAELEIFNRWGDLVFAQQGYDNTWQGTNEQGQPLPAGAYYYVLQLKDTNETVLAGGISVLR